MASSLSGRRIHVAGSASPDTDPRLLGYAHELVRRLVRSLLTEGAALVVQAGREPVAEGGSPASLIFDWTVLETARECLGESIATTNTPGGALILAASSEKATREIPRHRRKLWDELLRMGAIQLERIPPGWRSGAILRARQASFGNVLVTLGGGAGVEHLAQLYAERYRPIVPLDLPLGSSRGDATIGGEGLARRALSEPERFIELRGQEDAAARLAALSTRAGQVDPLDIADRVVRLIRDLAAPEAFYGRVLNPEIAEFRAVERFFRNVVDVVVEGAGYRRVEIGTDEVKHGFLNVEIFERLHFSSVAVIDLTALRPNCLIELGYALGRGVNSILMARKGTQLPFDSAAIPCHFWRDSGTDESRIAELKKFWQANINRPPLVKPPGLV